MERQGTKVYRESNSHVDLEVMRALGNESTYAGRYQGKFVFIVYNKEKSIQEYVIHVEIAGADDDERLLLCKLWREFHPCRCYCLKVSYSRGFR